VPIVCIDPAPGKTARYAQRLIRPRPGCDRFLALAMAQVLEQSGHVAADLNDWSRDAAAFLALARSRSLAAWCALAGVSEKEVRWLADVYGNNAPANIQIGWGLQRRAHAAVTVRCIDALAALTSNIGVVGGGVTFSYARRAAFDLAQWGPPAERRGIPDPLLGKGILACTDPPIRAVVIDNGNPVAMLPDSKGVQQALQSRELVVVLEQFLTDTAQCADVVLPVTTMLEENDILGSYGHHGLIATQAVATRLPGTRTDLEIYQALAERLGFGADMAGSDVDWCERILANVGAGFTRQRLLQSVVRNPKAERVFRADRKFATDDARFHFVTHVPMDAPRTTQDYPLLLGSFSTSVAQSSQWSRPLQDLLPARCHPDAAPWARDGQEARLENHMGSLRVRVVLDAAVHPEIVLVPKGGWLRDGHAANSLVPAEATDQGLGGNYYDVAVRLVPAPDGGAARPEGPPGMDATTAS
jgi:anaerobic selenocysteine-containing dehydrogenase